MIFSSADVLAIDGGSGTGKSTVRMHVASSLGYLEFDSGALYRALSLCAVRAGISFDDVTGLVSIARGLEITTKGKEIFLAGKNETAAIRSEQAGMDASVIGKIPEVRRALLDFQQALRVLPGLVADGRDMGYVYDTPYRYFIKTDVEVRARRRYQELVDAGDWRETYESVLRRLIERDEADTSRSVRPLKPHPKALILYNNGDIADVVRHILADYNSRKN